MMASDLLLLLGTRDYLLVTCIILCRANDNTTLLACDGKTPKGLSMCCLAHLLNILNLIAGLHVKVHVTRMKCSLV